MNGTKSIRAALRDIFHFHAAPQVWLPVLFVGVAAAALVMLLVRIPRVQPGTG